MKQVDWERRRRNLRLLIAYKGTNATQLSKDAGLSPNTISQFTSGRTSSLSEHTLSQIMPLLDMRGGTDLDTDNPIADPMIAIRNLLDDIPEEKLPALLQELKARFGS